MIFFMGVMTIVTGVMIFVMGIVTIVMGVMTINIGVMIATEEKSCSTVFWWLSEQDDDDLDGGEGIWTRRDMGEGCSCLEKVQQLKSFLRDDPSEGWIASANQKPGFNPAGQWEAFIFRDNFASGQFVSVICNLQLADAKESELWYIREWVKGLCSYIFQKEPFF